MVMFKPSVIRHPVTGERSLMINISGALEVQGLKDLLIDAFLSDYYGWRWLIHRLCWRHPWIPLLPVRARRFLFRALRPKISTRVKPSQIFVAAEYPARVGSAFTPEDVKIVASAIRRRYSSFLWKRGDV